jgi:hypothetical protein
MRREEEIEPQSFVTLLITISGRTYGNIHIRKAELANTDNSHGDDYQEHL